MHKILSPYIISFTKACQHMYFTSISLQMKSRINDAANGKLKGLKKIYQLLLILNLERFGTNLTFGD